MRAGSSVIAAPFIRITLYTGSMLLYPSQYPKKLCMPSGRGSLRHFHGSYQKNSVSAVTGVTPLPQYGTRIQRERPQPLSPPTREVAYGAWQRRRVRKSKRGSAARPLFPRLKALQRVGATVFEAPGIVGRFALTACWNSGKRLGAGYAFPPGSIAFFIGAFGHWRQADQTSAGSFDTGPTCDTTRNGSKTAAPTRPPRERPWSRGAPHRRLQTPGAWEQGGAGRHLPPLAPRQPFSVHRPQVPNRGCEGALAYGRVDTGSGFGRVACG